MAPVLVLFGAALFWLFDRGKAGTLSARLTNLETDVARLRFELDALRVATGAQAPARVDVPRVVAQVATEVPPVAALPSAPMAAPKPIEPTPIAAPTTPPE